MKILLFADDIALLPCDEQSLFQMNSHVDLLNLANNGKINRSKCSVIPLDEYFTDSEIQGIPTIRDGQSERYLGYEIYKNKKMNGIPNAISKFEITLKKWKGLHLSLYGAANVLRSYALPLITYQTYVDSPSIDQIKKVNNLCKWFLFSNESLFDPNKQYRSLLNDSRVFLPQKEGGLGVTPFDILLKAQKIFWMKRFINNDSTGGWVFALKSLLLKGFNKFAPVESLNKVPQWLLDEKKLLTIKNILITWFSIKKKFQVEKESIVGILNPNGSLKQICKFFSKEIKLSLLRNQMGKLLPTTKLIDQKSVTIIPLRSKVENGALYYRGILNKKKILKSLTFEDGKPIISASLREISKNIIKPRSLPPKQMEWETKYENFSDNFRILHTSKVRMRIKSNIFKRFSNILPRVRDENCPLCPGMKETSDHILTECSFLRTQISKLKNIISTYLNVNVEPIHLMTQLSDDERVRPLQLFALHNVWTIRCKKKFDSFIPANLWDCLMQNDLERFLFKESLKRDKEIFIESWNSLISFINDSLIIQRVFHAPSS